jgi:hypothetical protein
MCCEMEDCYIHTVQVLCIPLNVTIDAGEPFFLLLG